MLKHIILDVDGTLTDSGIYYDNYDNEIKKFSAKDGTGIVCAKAAGINIIVLTGRECKATTKRLKELGIEMINQKVKDKAAWVRNWMQENSIEKNEVGYIGDDINDLKPMRLCSYIGCPADAAIEVQKIADYVSNICGGHGAVRDVIEHYLKSKGVWEDIITKVYDCGI